MNRRCYLHVGQRCVSQTPVSRRRTDGALQQAGPNNKLSRPFGAVQNGAGGSESLVIVGMQPRPQVVVYSPSSSADGVILVKLW